MTFNSLPSPYSSPDTGDDSCIFPINASILDLGYTSSVDPSPYCRIMSRAGPTESYPLEGLDFGPLMDMSEAHPNWIRT